MNSHPILSRFPTGPALLGALALCLAPDAARAAASIVIVNGEPTPMDDLADVVVLGSISEVLPAIIDT